MDEFRNEVIVFSSTQRVLKLRRATWSNVPVNQHNLLVSFFLIAAIFGDRTGIMFTVPMPIHLWG